MDTGPDGSKAHIIFRYEKAGICKGGHYAAYK